MKKNLSDITRAEWIAYQWIEVTSMGETDRTFVSEFKRTPDEAMEAAYNWDSTAEERATVLDVEAT